MTFRTQTRDLALISSGSLVAGAALHASSRCCHLCPTRLLLRTRRADKHPRQRIAYRSAVARAGAGRRHRLCGGPIVDHRSGPAHCRRRSRPACGSLGQGEIRFTGFRQGMDRAGDLSEMGASQRTRCRDRRACAAADHHRIGRQPGRNRRGRSGAFRNVGCVAGRASRLAGRQDRLRRLPDGQGARRQGLRQWRRCAQQGTVEAIRKGPLDL